MSASIRSPPKSSRDFLRERSKHLFGNRDRLEVAAAIARSTSSTVNATELSLALGGLPNNRVRAQLIALANAELLTAQPRLGTGPIWYARTPSSFWQTCIELSEPEGEPDGR